MAKISLLLSWYRKFLLSGILVFVVTIASTYSHYWIDLEYAFKTRDEKAKLTIIIPNDDNVVSARDLILEILDQNLSISHIKEPPNTQVSKTLEQWIGKENTNLIPIPKVIEVFHHQNRKPDWSKLEKDISLTVPDAWVVLTDESKESNRWKNHIIIMLFIIIYLFLIGFLVRKNVFHEKKKLKLERLLGASDQILIFRSILSSWLIIFLASSFGCICSLFVARVILQESFYSHNIMLSILIIVINSMVMSFLSSWISIREILRDTP